MTTTHPVRDERWFTALYRAQHGAVLAYARRRVDDADDVVAEVFAAAWRNRVKVPDAPLPWLLRTAANVVLHAHRSSGRRARLAARAAVFAATTPDHADDVAQGADASSLVLDALRTLSTADQEVLRLVAWEDLDRDQLAEALDCSAGTARVRLHRARRRLEAELTRVGATAHGTRQESS